MKSTFAKIVKSFLKRGGLALPLGALAVSTPVFAETLYPLQAYVFSLGDQSAVVYYRPAGNTYEIVTTVTPTFIEDDERMQFVTLLAPGQKSHIALTGVSNPKDLYILEMARDGDKVYVQASQQRPVIR